MAAVGTRITDLDIERFTEGDCLFLARAIHRLTGWPMFALDDKGLPDWHVFVQMPDGRYLDVHGPQSEQEIVARFRPKRSRIASVIATSWRGLRAADWDMAPQFGPYTYTRARQIAKLLVARYDTGPVTTQTSVLAGA